MGRQRLTYGRCSREPGADGDGEGGWRCSLSDARERLGGRDTSIAGLEKAGALTRSCQVLRSRDLDCRSLIDSWKGELR